MDFQLILCNRVGVSLIDCKKGEDMFDKSKKYKIAGSIIIVALLAVYLIFNINIKSADSYKSEKDNIGYEKVTDEVITDNQTAEGEVTVADISQNETENYSSENSKDNGESLELVTVQNAETSTKTVQDQTIQKETLQNQTVEPTTQQTDNIKDNTSNQIMVSIEITCTSAVEKKPQIQNEGIKNSIPDDGIILKKTSYKVPENADVYTLLAKVAADNNIPIKANTNKTYVSSINNLAQMMLSQQSGWKYSVNDKIPSAAACDYKLSDGDTVKWFYVLSIYEGE